MSSSDAGPLVALVRAITQAPDDESTLERTVLYLRRRVRPVVWTLGLGLLLAGAVNFAIGVPDSLPPVSDLEVTRAETRLERHTDLYEALIAEKMPGIYDQYRVVQQKQAELAQARAEHQRAVEQGRRARRQRRLEQQLGVGLTALAWLLALVVVLWPQRPYRIVVGAHKVVAGRELDVDELVGVERVGDRLRIRLTGGRYELTPHLDEAGLERALSALETRVPTGEAREEARRGRARMADDLGALRAR